MYILVDYEHEPVGIFRTEEAAWRDARRRLEYDIEPDEIDDYLEDWHVAGPFTVAEV